jgi:periplasmic mercuric ion binding protein
MKNIFIALLLIVSTSVFSQKKSEEIKIKTSAQCDMCKKRIEKAVKAVNGVQKATLDMTSKTMTVKYKSELTNADAIRTAISNAGYDADEVKANASAYEKLPGCCQKK